MAASRSRRRSKGRDGDIVGLGFGYGLISSGTRGFDAATAAFAPPGTLTPIRSSETFIETFYTINLATWWQLTPDFQYLLQSRRRHREPDDSDAARA